MKLSTYLLAIAVILALIALVDFVSKKFFRKWEHPGSIVRLPRYSFILGILLSVLGVIALVHIPRTEQRLLWFGCWVVLVMGLFILVNFFWTGIFYDSEGFTYRAFPGRAKSYRYEQITGQRTFAARSGWNATLYLGDEEVQLYAAMQGLHDFMKKAFLGWCRQKGIDPDTLEYDPQNLLYFPDPDDGGSAES